ncbi:MAG: Fe-S protein assembly chaperone HscA [Gammaproteobacteria bacterium]|nr:MAG: Fe-S protein assembly chaperone HscA [Gammaproteobacteria bacterium]
MALLQISEPGQTPAPHQRKRAVGIDLGTTHSLVAAVRNGVAETLPDEAGRHLLPSVVHYPERGAPLVGDEALARAEEDPLNTIASVKRLMGRGIGDVAQLGRRLPYRLREEGGMLRIATAAGEVTPVEVSAEILKALKSRAEATLGGELDGAVITVPAYFDDAQRQATKDAARLAGLKVLRLLNEPTAAAVAYGLDREAEGIHGVFDLGGGTFDVSILRLHQGVFEVMATGGDTALGGDDMDRAIARWIMEQAGIEAGGEHLLRRLMKIARAAKEALTGQESVPISVTLEDGRAWKGVLDRQTFDALIDPLIDRALQIVRRTLKDAGLSPREVMDVVMVGGATRIPRVRERVAALFGREPLVDIDPDRVVAIGAAIQADILAGNKPESEMLLLDVLPLSLGIETMGGLVEPILPRNTPIPATRAQDFTTFKEGQTAMAIHVVQGERELVQDNRSLARFELRGIPPMAAGAARIRVTFQVDADGLLSVTAQELTTGVESHVEVKPSYGLSEEAIERMLKEAMAHAREDMDARNLKEQQVEAQQVLEALRSAMEADGHLLKEGERRDIEKAIEGLEETLRGEDWKAIKRAIQELDRASQSFVQRRMDESLKKALAGHKLEALQSDA